MHVISHFESFKLPTIRMYFALKIFPKPIYKYDDIAMAVVMVCAVTCIPDTLSLASNYSVRGGGDGSFLVRA